MPNRVAVVVGTRPEAVKMAPVFQALKERSGIEVRLVCTGQHEALLSDVFPVFSMVPDVNLEIMRPDQTLADVGAECLCAITEEFEAWRPELVLVQGDTASAFFSALAAFFLRIPIGHVEAGLRSGDLGQPFPEEGFRRLIDGLATLHFCPTSIARQNLAREGIGGEDVYVTGNTVVDALLAVARRQIPTRTPVLRRLLEPGAPPFILVTAHRRESFGAPMERLFEAIQAVTNENPDVEVVFPVHPNPSVSGPASRVLGENRRVHLTPPMTYPDLVLAMRHAALVMTDSGGIQEEAPTFGTPVLVLREVTDRPEGIEAGVAELVGTDREKITRRVREILRGGRPDSPRAPGRVNPHGEGDAAPQIAEAVSAYLIRAGRGSR